MSVNTLIFAHRGAKGTHPENTMIAFQTAEQQGADGIELDVQLSKDGVPVVIHDETVDRTTNGSGWVKDMTYQELQTLDAGSWFDPSFTGQRIPTLNEVLAWVRDTPLLINIELKNGIVPYPNLEQIVIDLVHRYQLEKRVILSSFNHYSLVDIHRLAPHLETAILYMEGLYEPWHYARRIGASALHCYLPAAVPKMIEEAKRAGMPLRPFTVNREEDISSLMQAGCAAIFTDWPERARNIRQTLSHS
ncbi:glycerophosphoryl diester phosphodiesterase [Caldalkalibacillus uzonensis]|uniref:Glycerophosphoryl diester phosphodiesterase n=1 Tax=Caldalkalibacillus uzonensis TaxID=353224 RepID=A0ABU0CWR9_9BACI|nr:glycerophosphodiester phosphodiesterase [Caldalkalibacillus uzonensis]MDQ0340870.1 glycerophosphoryl diester phosphodiesterase [Caldalkalibacillus uzonensis]